MKKIVFCGVGAVFLLALLSRFYVIDLNRIPIKRESRISESRQALDLLTDIRAYPQAEIPEVGLTEAFSHSKSDLQKQNHGADVAHWRAIGPNNIAGRMLALAINPVNPNTVYAGSASGGLWRSYSGGSGENAWTLIATGFPVLGVAAIAISPTDTSTVYIGTGEVYGSPETMPGVSIRTTRGSYGIGILKTSDSGQTWTKSLDWSFNQRRGVQKIRIDRIRPNIIWAASTEGVFKSVDDGGFWDSVFDIPMATDIAINPHDTDIVFVACGGMGSPGHGIYRTRDGGLTWRKLDLGPDGPDTFEGKALLSLSPSDPNIVYASIGASNGGFTPNLNTWLCKTTDGGDSWQTVSTIGYASFQGWYSHDVAVNPINSSEVWCAGVSFYPYLSREGGRNLQHARYPTMFLPITGGGTSTFPHQNVWADYHEIVFHPTDPKTIYFIGDGGVFRTRDGGQTSENFNSGLQTTQFYNGTTSSRTDSLLFVGGLQDNESVVYEGALSWRRVGNSDGSWTAIPASSRNEMYVSSQRGSVIRLPDYKLDENEFIAPSDRRLPSFVAPFILSPVANRTIYAGSTLIHKSTDAGKTWETMNRGEPLDGNPILSMVGSFQYADVVFAATSPVNQRAHVFRTRSGGISWIDVTGDLPDRHPTDLALDPNSDRKVYITFGGFGTPHVYKSEDGGGSWSSIDSGLPDIPTWAVAVDPLNADHLYVGNDLSVYVSTTGGAEWQEYSSGLPDAVIAMDLSISWSNRVLRVATHGNGAFERPLLGSVPLVPRSQSISEFRLEQNYPNPFNPETTIEYWLSGSAHVVLKIYNAIGQEVRTLIDDNALPGVSIAVWQGEDNQGRIVSSGVYFATLQIGETVQCRKMLFIR